MSADTFFNGRITVFQSRTGYRFSIDAVLLAWHARARAGERILDLGTGCGIIPLIMSFREISAAFWGIDIQPQLSAIAALNVARNELGSRIRIRCRDLRKIGPDDCGGHFDAVVSNPPFRKIASGRINPNGQRALARHEIAVTLTDLIEAAARMLKPGGRFATLYPAERLVDVLALMRTRGIEPKFLRTIHSRAGERAKLFIVDGTKGGRPAMHIAPPLYIYRSGRTYTDEVERMFQP